MIDPEAAAVENTDPVETAPVDTEEEKSDGSGDEETAEGDSTEEAPAEETVERGVWHENEDGSMTIAVEEDVEYEYKNSGLKITFTKLPDNPGEITVKELTLTEEQRRELGALTTTAWDITSTMENGSFEYDLVLPLQMSVDPEKVTVVYVEEEEDLDDASKAKGVEREDVEFDEEKGEVEVSNLDHFTIFFQIYNEPTLSISANKFLQGDTIYFESKNLTSGNYYRTSLIPDGGNQSDRYYISGCSQADPQSFSYVLPIDAKIGSGWKAELHGFTTLESCEDPRNNHDASKEIVFEVAAGVLALGVVANFPDDCSFQCSANDVTVLGMELVKNLAGDQLTCNPGESTTAYIKITYDNHSTDRYAVFMIGDIYQDGVFKQSISGQSTCLDHMATGTDSKIVSTGFTWDCGESISIKKLTLSWDTNVNTCTDFFQQAKCNPSGQSYCNNGLDFIVTTPLVADFSSENVCLGETTDFTNETTGGVMPYSFNWNFGDGGTQIQKTRAISMLQLDLSM